MSFIGHMSCSPLDSVQLRTLEYIVTHVFFPLKLPDGDDYSVLNNCALAGAVSSIARVFCDHADNANLTAWRHVSRMLDNLQATVQLESLDRPLTISQLSGMSVGDVVIFLIRAQNAAVVFRKQSDVTIFESFETSPKAKDVMATHGKLICSYPGPAIEIPNVTFEDEGFLSELINFLIHMNDDVLDATPETRKAQTLVVETRDTTHPRYITELLTGILRSIGSPAEIVRISKRVGDDVVWNNSKLPWRRSSLWLVIRVAIQTFLRHSALETRIYKEFMLFFMCHLAQEEMSADLSNDVLQCMSAKICRRLRKLGPSVPDWLSGIALETCSSLRSILEKRWREVQAVERVSFVRTPSQFDLGQDTQLSLTCSGDYLRDALSSRNIHPLSTPFDPKHRRRGILDDFLSSDGFFFEEAYRAEPHVALYDVEWAVEQDIDGWVNRAGIEDEACVKLEILANKYSSSAMKTYENNPELLSVMLLTTLELWIALDKIAIKAIPMLADYSPEIPAKILEDLLLCKTRNLARLRRAHLYLSDRHSRSRSWWSVFSPTIDGNSFSVRFYRSSSHLQYLKARIEEVARREVREKADELERTNARHAELRELAAKSEHQYFVNRYGATEHAGYCNKCYYDRSFRNMEISLHEWPLPTEQFYAEAVVFELDCPVSFNMWRTATFHLLVDLCSPSSEPSHPYIQLSGYNALRPYLVQHPRSRITFASDTKPFVVTRYSRTSVPATRERVCVNNGLSFYCFDERACIPVSQFHCVDIRRYCTHWLQSEPYQNLQKYVDTTSHTSNEVMASQADCHKDLSIHEFMAFGHLRSGGRLQWLNILREIRSRSLSFHRPEIHLLLAQAVCQVGPFENMGWTWHEEIQQPSFCHALLGELESLIRDVEANWQEAVTMDTISFLLRRLLASNPDQAVTQQVVGLLRTARSRVFSWVQELSAKLANTPGDEELRGFLREAAIICRSTFDVDLAVVPMLLHSAEDMGILLSCAVLIHDHTPSKVSSLSPYSQLLLDRDRRASLILESLVSRVIQTDPSNEGINLAVGRVWPHYRPGSKWLSLPNPNSRWLSCTTAKTDDQCSQVVHFNLLDGSLLVDGKPLGRLPREIQQHALYNLIFGEKVLDVLPSDLPGMDYATRSMIFGHQVYFSLKHNGSDLVIRAKVGSEAIELIPQEKLEGDFPRVLVEGHAHWLNLSTSVMEIRPLDNLWEASSENWKMDCSRGPYRMCRDRETLVDIRSESWAMVSHLVKPLDTPWNLLVTVSSIDIDQSLPSLQLTITLPRYRLSFYIDQDGDLQSQTMRGMVYDENQSMGTWFGLTNRLVLRPKLSGNISIDELVPRCVLVPEGTISFHMDGHHPRIRINTSGSVLQRITYQTYSIDTDLGCLTGNGSLTSKLYCAYLHAVTSGCGTDPLTGRSGTEEALSLLRSAGCWSVMRFDSRDAEILGLLASLCPSRAWYPRDLQCMQQVKWLNLPVASQYEELFVVSKAIMEHYERLALFHEGCSRPLFPKFPSRDPHLTKRCARRAAYLFPSEFSGQVIQEADCDAWYRSRDLVLVGSGEHLAHTAAIIVRRRAVNSTPPKDILRLVESLTETVSRDNATLSLRYDRSWLAPDFSSIWLKAYNLLRGSDERRWFQLLFSLPAMAYASSELMDLVSAFVAFAADSRFRSENPPHYDSYNPSEGYTLCSHTLRGYISGCAHNFERSPESDIYATANESYDSLRRRQTNMYDDRRNSDMDATVQRLLSAWPCETPPPCSLDAHLYDVGSLASNVRGHFSSRYRNLKLREHLIRVQNILNDVQAQVFPNPTLPYSFAPPPSAPVRISWSLTLQQLLARRAPSSQPAHGRRQFSNQNRILRLKDHLVRVHTILNRAQFQAVPNPDSQYSFDSSQPIYSCVRWLFWLHLLVIKAVTCLRTHDESPQDLSEPEDVSISSPAPLHRLIATAEANAANPFQNDYLSALRASADCFRDETSLVARGATNIPTTEALVAHYGHCRLNYINAFRHLKLLLEPISESEQVLEYSGQWPRLTPYTLFRALASNSSIILSEDWKKCIIRFTLLALELQRARRLLRLQLGNLHGELHRELQNDGCDGWDSESHPDWLLVQLQCNFLARRVQVDVANEMIAPRSGNNTTMQLNMGEGKSSVIVPIVAAVLADGDQLVRVIVPKALTAQMFQLLVDRLGGLVNRRIYVVPFSRSLEVDYQKVGVLRELMSECMKERGILVVQPEHVLSLRLVSVEKQLPQMEGDQLAEALLDLQKWLHTHSRDVLDESDEILHVRYQLVYTIGHQQHMEGFPERWTTTAQVLGLVSKHASSLQQLFPSGVEYERGPSGSFPHFRILDMDAGLELISRTVHDIMGGLLPNFSFGQLPSGLKEAIRSFISCADVPPENLQSVCEYADQSRLWGGLLLLRGLLSAGILLFAFRERRWRVDYGLALSRTMLAVPYRAKDVPAQRAEFGHPDVAIILTCLSYYYGGLSEEQLRVSFEILLKQDDPSLDYDLWTRDCPDVPENLRTISGVNIKSAEQWKGSLVPLFSRNQATVDFYLSGVVFPKEAKEFPCKLSCSGWDLAEKKERLVTGFSGTNDGQYLLPLHISQCDPDHQRGTNAKILSYLLQPENRCYMCTARNNGERRTTREFLETLVSQTPEIRVLLDVGAQMLDLQNHELAQVWLDVNQNVSAAIYFNEDDELTVRTRDGSTQLLISSPFAQQLDQCVVYLDDAHTRGTDIKFPHGFRAAVTLGPKVTKDRLAQGCMRMRKLGHEHSVMFFAPLEVDRRVRSVAGKDEASSDIIDTMDILHWVIRETCDDIQKRAPQWAQQGMDHGSRYATWTSFCEDRVSSGALSEKWLQPEAKKLEELYGCHSASSPALPVDSEIRQRCMDLGILSLHDVSMDEEQEREVIHEVERERQVERPPRVPPANHSLHPDVGAFVVTGTIPTYTDAFRPAFEALDATSAYTDEAHIWGPLVLATADFQRTVSSSGRLDEYLRPVQWIISGKRGGNEVLVILSPHEADHLISSIRLSNKVHLHVYTPRITKSMKSCDDLALYSTPTVPLEWAPPRPLMDRLNVFAGQLYLKDYETYIRLCRFLCVYARDLEGEEGIKVGSDGFISPKNRPSHLPIMHTFQNSPVHSLKILMSLRRKGMRFAPTHMGQLLDGRLLLEDGF